MVVPCNLAKRTSNSAIGYVISRTPTLYIEYTTHRKNSKL